MFIADIAIYIIVFSTGIYYYKASKCDYVEASQSIKNIIEKNVENGKFQDAEEAFVHYRKFFKFIGILFMISSLAFVWIAIYSKGEGIVIG